jgi:hypothetical protein
LTVPAAKYDLRIGLSSEKDLRVQGEASYLEPPQGWAQRRVKRRRSYARRDQSIVWRIDVTEVAVSFPPNRAAEAARSAEAAHLTYEVEVELLERAMLRLVNESDEAKLRGMASQYAQQLWWIASQLNPISDVIDVEEMLQPHPDVEAVCQALGHCAEII